MAKINKDKISDRVCHYLRNKILTLEYQPGEHIVELKVAHELGVSQASVREALQMLESMCLVKKEPYVGCTVQQFDARRIRQAYEMRTMLECYVASRFSAAENKHTVDEMEMMLKKMYEDAENNEREDLIKDDVRFHELLVQSVDNPVLEKMWDVACAQQWTYITINSKEDMSYFPASHDKILQYLKEDNIEALQEEVRSHFVNSYYIVMEAFEDSKKKKEKKKAD
ncbi:MAG: GntR family transcriptional regulator [Lachnospiraceae bacterium]|nr:GntR family transcriptional regulator [Candidatus Equihabitans merdae]